MISSHLSIPSDCIFRCRATVVPMQIVTFGLKVHTGYAESKLIVPACDQYLSFFLEPIRVTQVKLVMAKRV